MTNGVPSSLLEFMKVEGLWPMTEDEKKSSAVEKLKEIVRWWAQKVAWQRHLKKNVIAETSATILTYGSYGLGVRDMESDIDALCVGPCFATMEVDFFIVLFHMLKSREDVSELRYVKEAKVPRMQFKLEGISIGLSYVQLKDLYVPENVDELDRSSLGDIDETSWKYLSDVRSSRHVLQFAPNLENFKALLLFVKLWAKRRGVYGHQCGFLGGGHLAILSAFVCQSNHHTLLIVLISEFFKTFALWPWPTPVVLQDEKSPPAAIENQTEASSFMMPIRSPCNPDEYCSSNITTSTFYKIRVELLRGHSLTKDFAKKELNWGNIFERFPYSKKYTKFLKIYLSAPSIDELREWVETVKSKFCSLILMLEESYGKCDPNPTCYTDTQVMGNWNAAFYWGLQPGKSCDSLDLQQMKESFIKSLDEDGVGSLELSIAPAAEMAENEKNFTSS